MRFGKMKNKGAAIILVAGITLGFLLVFAVLAIDFSRMYYVRGELQNAADSAALAGADKLTVASDSNAAAYEQEPARQEAWKFACRNLAAGSPVYLSTNSPSTCNTPPLSTALNGGSGTNLASGDIIVGNWRTDITGVTCSTGWVPFGSGFFCRADGTTGLSINAVRVMARRTLGSPGGNVSFILPGIVPGLSNMGVQRDAIASFAPMNLSPIPVCIPSCSLVTPLKVQWGYNDSPKSGHDPILCSDSLLPTGPVTSSDDDLVTPSATPGQAFFFNSSHQNDIPKPGMGWTNFKFGDCSGKCDQPTSGDIAPYILGTMTPPDICNKNICTTNGNISPLADLLADKVTANSIDTPVDTQIIHGWTTYAPVVSPCDPINQSCPGDPKGKPYPVVDYAKVLVTDVNKGSGKEYVRIIGLLTTPVHQTFNFQCFESGNLVNKTMTRWVTSFNCADCKLPTEGGKNAKLVK